MPVKDIMQRQLVRCAPSQPVADAARLMQYHDIGFLTVIDDKEHICGVVTDRDLVCRCIAQGRDPTATTTGEVLSAAVVTVSEEADINECLSLMATHQVKRLLVTQHDGSPCGVISQADVATVSSNEQLAHIIRGIDQTVGQPTLTLPDRAGTGKVP